MFLFWLKFQWHLQVMLRLDCLLTFSQCKRLLRANKAKVQRPSSAAYDDDDEIYDYLPVGRGFLPRVFPLLNSNKDPLPGRVCEARGPSRLRRMRPGVQPRQGWIDARIGGTDTRREGAPVRTRWMQSDWWSRSLGDPCPAIADEQLRAGQNTTALNVERERGEREH